MASAERQAEETRIRRILEVNSFDLVTLENYLAEKGYIPDSTDEQAARDAVYRLRQFCNRVPAGHTPVSHLFVASENALTESGERESESAKYEAVRDLISRIATPKAQAAIESREQQGHGVDTAVKSEEA